jgi:hypothetical protein
LTLADLSSNNTDILGPAAEDGNRRRRGAWLTLLVLLTAGGLLAARQRHSRLRAATQNQTGG